MFCGVYNIHTNKMYDHCRIKAQRGELELYYYTGHCVMSLRDKPWCVKNGYYEF